MSPVHTHERKTAVTPRGKYRLYGVSLCHTAITIPSLESPVLFHRLVPSLHTHTRSHWAFSHFGAANSLIITYLLFSDCCSEPDLCSQVKVGPAGKNKLPLQVHPVFNLLLSHWIPFGGFLTSYCFPSFAINLTNINLFWSWFSLASHLLFV